MYANCDDHRIGARWVASLIGWIRPRLEVMGIPEFQSESFVENPSVAK